MFLIDRPAAWPGPRADLMPSQLFGAAGDLIRAALVAIPPLTGPAASSAQRAAQRERALPTAAPTPVQRRKVG